MLAGGWVAIQRNPRSGSGSRRRALIELIETLRRCNVRPRLFSCRDAMRRCLERPERRATLRCLVAAGGDGTVCDLINRYPGLPLAVLPLGTENLLARYLGVARCGATLARTICEGKTRRIDVCRLGERRFLLMASAGYDADVIHRLEAQRTGNITHFSYVPAILDAARHFEFPELRVYLDDATEPITGAMAVVSNLPVYAFGLPIAAGSLGDDGLMDVRVFQRPSVFQLLRYCYHVVRHQHETLSDVICGTARKVRIESNGRAPIQVDGDGAGFTPAEIVMQPGALELVVP